MSSGTSPLAVGVEPAPTALAIRHLSKTFLGQRALADVDFDLRAGEVHALLGENGSGKSTLIKCLAGYYTPDPGAEFEISGAPLAIPYQPAQATDLGMVFVHQDLGLIPNLSVAENFAISRSFDAGLLGRIPWKAIQARAVAELKALGHDIDPTIAVGRLSIAEQTIVAIARALASAAEGARVLVLDEPTAALPDARRRVDDASRNEVELLFEAIRRVVAAGVGVIYVSHKLNEILDLADRATILRDGRRIQTIDVPGMSEGDLVRAIVGHDVATVSRATASGESGRECLVAVSGLSGRKLRDVSFAVDRGEVVGIAGMLGSGRSELGRLLFGAQQPTGGRIELRGSVVRYDSPRDAVRLGVALIPEDRRKHGGFLDLPVSQNLTLPSIRQHFRGGRIMAREERDRVSRLIGDFHINPPVPSRKFRVLSGGNQQKVVVAKWLSMSPDLVIFDEPVQGVDVGARAEIYDLVNQAAAGGAGVLLISSELDQMIQLCSRILVLRDGRLIADVPASGIDRHELTQLIYFGGDAPAQVGRPATAKEQS